jgi:integrase
MPFKKSLPKGGRVVRVKRADGTTKEYRYPAYKAKQESGNYLEEGTVAALIRAFTISPEWRDLAQSTRSKHAIYLKNFEQAHGLTKAASISRNDVIDLRNAIATTRGNGAAMGFVRAVSVLFGWAVESRRIEHNPASRLKALKGGHLPAWSDAEADRATCELPEHLRRAIVLARYTGQRRGDLCRLTWAAYDGKALRLVQEKTKAELVVPVHPALKSELDKWRSEMPPMPSRTILAKANGKPWSRPQRLTAQLAEALEKRGMRERDALNMHGLRKLAAAALAEAGCTMHEIASITGHKSLAMIELYTKSAEQKRLAETAMERLTNRHTKYKPTERNQ